MIEYFTSKNNEPSCIIVVEDTYKYQPLQEHIQFEIRQTTSSKKSQNHFSFLKIYKSIKVILT